MESQYFIFDGIKSIDMDLHIMKIEHRGFIETPYLGGADIREEDMPNRLTSYFYNVEREPIEFTVQLVLADRNNKPKEWTPQERYKIANWLVHDTYKEFQTSDDLGKKYYAMCVDVANLFLLNKEGYAEITFRTNSPFAWSPTYIDSFDLSDNVGTEIIELENRSNVLMKYKPKIEIEMTGDTDVTLKNLSNGGKETKLEGLRQDEVISLDNENELILSSYPININPLKNFNRGWFELVFGINKIEVSGRCKIYVKSVFPIAQ